MNIHTRKAAPPITTSQINTASPDGSFFLSPANSFDLET